MKNTKTRLFIHNGKICHIVDEWAGDRVSIRYGTPGAWQGQVIVNYAELSKA